MGSTDWLIIALSRTRINALLTGVSLSIATAFSYCDLHLSHKKVAVYESTCRLCYMHASTHDGYQNKRSHANIT